MTKETKEEKPKVKKKFSFLEEPMNDTQVMEWWIFACAMIGVVVGVLVDKIALSLLLGTTFGLLLSMIHRAFKKK